MANEADGLIAIVKRDCPTCELVAPVLQRLKDTGVPFTIYTQDDPTFPDGMDGVVDDTALEQSFHHDVEFVPTLIRREKGAEVERTFGWNREDWEKLTGIQGLGEGLPENQPGCGSKSVEPGVHELLQARYGAVPMKARKIAYSGWDDPVEQAFSRGWTDGLPIVPPTDERILRMLQGTPRDPAEIVGIIPPDMKECTVEKVAINAVMAGCLPEYMPVVLAVVEAALDPRFCMHGLSCTLSYSGPVIVVNGPITKQIGMNWGHNCLGQGNRANATIGRTLQLIIRNVGGGRPGEIDRSVFGNPGKFTYCFAEDETDATWTPLHVARGVAPGRNAVTLHQGHGLTSFSDNRSRTGEELARSMALQLVNDIHPKVVQTPNVILCISPEHYRIFEQDGWDRAKIEDKLHEYTTRPGKDLVQGAHGVPEGVSPEKMKDMMPKFWRDHGLLIVRCGGTAGLLSAIIGGWSGGRNHDEIQPVTKEF